MSQNIYDTPIFFQNYSKLERSVRGLDGAPEWPSLRALLPAELGGLQVVDLGCGFGWFCRWASDHGAARVRGIDLSQSMLDRARAMTDAKYNGITYERADLDSFKADGSDHAAYDLVFSSLMLHYLVDLQGLVDQAFAMLKPGGHFVFSAEHPILTAPSKPGMVINPQTGRKYWPLDDYQREGLRVTNWLADGVKKQHRTVATYINILLSAGFELTAFEEWRPTAAELEAHPKWDDENIKPNFMLMRATKRSHIVQ
jgi:SAM-dependent methyltransferase